MTDKEELNKAKFLADQGNVRAAKVIVLALAPTIKDPALRLELAGLAMGVLNDATDNILKANLANEGGKLAGVARLADIQAQFIAKEAELLMHQLTGVHHRRQLLKLAPGWFQFSTDADKNEFEALDKLIREKESHIDHQFHQAESVARASGNATSLCIVLMAKGAVGSSKYLLFKMECMRNWRAKLWSRFEFFRQPVFEYLLTFSNDDARKLKAHLKAFSDDLIEAARLAEEANDVHAGYAYQNLALYLKSAYRFSAAKRYARKARAIAVKHGDVTLLEGTKRLDKMISARNKDIPDYLHGERREDDDD